MGAVLAILGLVLSLFLIVFRIAMMKTYSSWGAAVSTALCAMADWIEGSDGEYSAELKTVLDDDPEDAGLAYAVQSLAGASIVRSRSAGKAVLAGGRRIRGKARPSNTKHSVVPGPRVSFKPSLLELGLVTAVRYQFYWMVLAVAALVMSEEAFESAVSAAGEGVEGDLHPTQYGFVLPVDFDDPAGSGLHRISEPKGA